MAAEVKICGITRPEDAALAASLGVARLGVVFAWGPRVVDRRRAREIVRAASGVPVLGVVAGSDPLEGHLDLVREVGLTGLQLHGGSDRATAAAIRRAGFECWRVVELAASVPLAAMLDAAAPDADLVLLEPRVAGGAGGRGVALDLELGRRAREHLGTVRTGLAGGLTPTSVGEAIRLVGPDLVDVSSGVESSPGIKDPARLRDFVEAVRDARTPG